MVDLTALCSGVYKALPNDGLIIVWNLTSRCNLDCIHCYIDAKSFLPKKELNTGQIKKAVSDLKDAKVRIIIFSGGEPLLRRDFFEIAEFTRKKGISIALSSNGVLINKRIAKTIKKAGIEYVGISIDGMKYTHDLLRQRKQAYELAMQAVNNCRDSGIKTGIRFTVARYNLRELKHILDLAQRLNISRFCLYHLVYSGRADKLEASDLSNHQRRLVIEELLRFAKMQKDKIQVLTTDNPCDGVYLYRMINGSTANLDALRGGCSAGVKLFNIDSYGNVHPCQFWQDYSLGNILKKPFSKIINSKDELLLKLKQKAEFLKGKCGRCDYKSICAGCRVRAKFVHNDIWQEDPSCFLADTEIRREHGVSYLSPAQVAAK